MKNHSLKIIYTASKFGNAIHLMALLLGLAILFLWHTPLIAKKSDEKTDTQAKLRKVSLQLSWLHQFQFAGYYAALEQGYYREAGFDVTILEGKPDRRPVPSVAAGEAEYGVARSELLLHRLKGKPVVMLANIFQHSATILMAKKESGIDNPHNMIGKRVMVLEGDDGAEFIAMFRSEDVSPDKIELLPSSFNVNDLIEDKIDVFNAYITNEPYLFKTRDIPVSIINPRAYGIDFYGDCLFTSEHELKTHPEQVKAFRQASLLGWQYALAHHEELIDVILNQYGVQKSRGHLRFEADAINKLMLPELIEVGHTNPGRWAHIARIYMDLGMVGSDAALAGFIYDPDPIVDHTWLWRGLFAAIFMGILTAIGAMVLLFFNRKLQNEVIVRRSAEDSLRQSELKYRSLFDSINSGVAVYRPINNGEDFIFQDFNKAGEHIEDISSKEVIGKSVLTVFPGIRDLGLFGVLQQVWRTGEPAYHPLSFYEDDRITGWRDNFIYKLPTDEIVAVYTDETMRKRSEQELVRRKDEQTLLLDTIDTQVWYLSDPETYGAVNKAHADFLGVKKERVANQPLGTIRSKEYLNGSITNNQHVFNSKKPLQIEEWSINGAGEHRLMTVTRTPKLDKNNEVKFVVCAGTDITDTKQLEEQVREAHKMKAIGTLSGGVAHEFNNLLGIILGNAELAVEDIHNDDPAQQFLLEILNASMRGKEIVSQLMSFSRENKKVNRPLNINKVVKEAIGLLRASIPKAITFKTTIPVQPLTTLGDSTQLHQVIINLCTNAAHAMEEEGGQITIETDKRHTNQTELFADQELPPGTYICLKIIDTGHGIADHIIERIFDPFFTTKPVDKGSGMGLAVVHGIIKSHGGGIRAKSRVGKGTVIECYFPHLEESAETQEMPSETEDIIYGGTEKILFVDDEVSIAILARKRLSRLGYQVIAHTDPLEAIDAYRQAPLSFDIVITDFTMPNMTGDKLIQKLKLTRADIKSIICSGFSDKIDKDRAIEVGADAFVMKPIEKLVLARTIRYVLDQ